MRNKTPLMLAVATVLLWEANPIAPKSTLVVAARECVWVSTVNGKAQAIERPKAQTFVVSGAFCGKVNDPLGPVTTPGVELEVWDAKTRKTVAKAKVDDHAMFTFAPLPPGTYRALVIGYAATAETVEIRTSSNQQQCERPLYIKLDVSSECAESRISDRPYQP